MLIQNAIKLIHSITDSWVRLDKFHRIPGGIELSFSIHKGKQGKKTDGWIVKCRGIHEAQITDLDGGGMALYPSSHPAAHQYFARRAELRWPRTCDETKVLAALYKAHVAETDDWIPFDRYLLMNTPWNGSDYLPHFAPVPGTKFVCRGPDFLIRIYAKALEAIGEQVQVTVRSNLKRKAIRPNVLHFGTSHVVAETFTAQQSALPK
ncbi:MAG: hypothetical protein ABSG51_02235 [Terracidiphilus sp.]|jgi:hypothetical protein